MKLRINSDIYRIFRSFNNVFINILKIVIEYLIDYLTNNLQIILIISYYKYLNNN